MNLNLPLTLIKSLQTSSSRYSFCYGHTEITSQTHKKNFLINIHTFLFLNGANVLFTYSFFSLILTNVPGYVPILTNFPGYVRILTNFPGYVRILTNFPRLRPYPN